MTASDRSDATLPSLVASLTSEYSEDCLSLTLIFHPHTHRIGECWTAPLSKQSRRFELNRHAPDFASPARSGSGAPLLERHVSRQALLLDVSEQRVLVTPIAGSCRCLLDNVLLSEAVTIDRERLALGVTLQLGHAVVLWLRMGPPHLPVTPGDADCEGLLGDGAIMQRVRRQVARAAATDLDLLILGETGVGKEVSATAVHRASRRAIAPLVSINMAAIPVSLAPALLFGSARGAFTGASRSQAGYFQQADGGTLFLDEIGDTPLEIQPQLLRALQQREVQVVGGGLQPVDVRIIAATDRALAGEDCDFNAALRHRLGTLEIQIPALRHHAEDIGQLLLHFLSEAAASIGSEDLLPGEDAEEVLVAHWAELFRLFAGYHWPGNIRELANAAQQVLVASEGRLRVPSALYERLQRRDPESAGADEPESDGGSALQEPVAPVGASTFRRVWHENGREVTAVARALGLSRQAVYRRVGEMPDLRLAADVGEEELREALAACGGDVNDAADRLAVSRRGLQARLRSSGGRP